MDNQILPNQIPVDTKKISPEKIIITVFSIVILVELIWAGYTFFYNKPVPAQVVNIRKADVVKKVTTMSIVPQKIEAKKNGKFIISININSDIYSDGTDLSLFYDPGVVSVVNEKNPVQTGNIYNSYPQNKVDVKKGIITLSGITDKKGGVLASGLFGTIEFIAKDMSTSKISIDFTPGSTTDSNIINSATGTDVLEKVENAEIDILP